MTTIPREQHVALFQLINKARMLNGWQTRTAKELDATIQTWGEILNRYQIPIDAYHDLYIRAFDTRQIKMRAGSEVPQMDATLIVAQWTGPNGLQVERHERLVNEGRTLTATAGAACPLCSGSGWRTIGDGRNAPVTRCIHE